MNENVLIAIKISLKFVPKGQINITKLTSGMEKHIQMLKDFFHLDYLSDDVTVWQQMLPSLQSPIAYSWVALFLRMEEHT